MPQPQPSSELLSQCLSKYILDEMLWDEFAYSYNSIHNLHIEFWANGIWIKELGIISYSKAAEVIRGITCNKADMCEVIEKGPKLKLVSGSQKSYYAVVERDGDYICECMLYKCRKNRLEEEFPELYRALDEQVFCHHTVAAGQEI